MKSYQTISLKLIEVMKKRNEVLIDRLDPIKYARNSAWIDNKLMELQITEELLEWVLDD